MCSFEPIYYIINVHIVSSFRFFSKFICMFYPIIYCWFKSAKLSFFLKKNYNYQHMLFFSLQLDLKIENLNFQNNED